ncbi:hypothetical protein H6G93_28340 [Nostoc sp. FACHB-973]|nr:hypothetical protein [Nostoc sp. FACHB-973]
MISLKLEKRSPPYNNQSDTIKLKSSLPSYAKLRSRLYKLIKPDADNIRFHSRFQEA